MLYPSISLIIPCYNETTRESKMVLGIQDFSETWKGQYEIIIIDDGSTDNTFGTLSQNRFLKSLQDKGVLQIIKQSNTGKGGALRHGVMLAKHDFILTLDADMATHPNELLNWISKKKTFNENEILIGSRELATSKVNDSLKRKIIGNIFNYLIRQIIKLDIKDTQCGFKLYPKSIAQKLFSDLQIKGWAHDVELLKKAQLLNHQIIEMPIEWNAVEGSKIRVLRDSWNMFWEVIRIRKITK
ncbi:MAG TPA: glycosyltransferase [Chitinophagaceae bacterium]|nr:MAG: family 2 glycosyl transferase [Bacteroidetes bacterium OLB11]HMN33374.1 glycosyltransferase [Chitinophagaceae bacterium]